jgi:hypothetical protein
MKKIILGLSGVIILVFVFILVANAKSNVREVKKACTEVSKDCSKCPAASGCGHSNDANVSEATTCDPAKCKELGCDGEKCKEGKCPETCKTACATASGDAKKCDQAKRKCCPGS